jgi:hypothetical protein
MKEVICVNNSNLPQGAYLEKDKKYTVLKEWINNFGQKTYIISETTNEGTTNHGMRWVGYDAFRFRSVAQEESVLEEYGYMLN